MVQTSQVAKAKQTVLFPFFCRLMQIRSGQNERVRCQTKEGPSTMMKIYAAGINRCGENWENWLFV